MKSIINISFYLMFIVMIGCKQSRQPNNETIKTDSVYVKSDKFSNGNIRRAQEFRKDSSGKSHGEGYNKRFYENGQLKEIAFFKHGIQDSVHMIYYPSGILKDSFYRTQGYRFGLQYEYYNDGKLSGVADCENDTIIFCKVQYDSSGDIKIVGGHFLRIFLDKKNKIKLDQPQKIFNGVTLLPNTTTVLHVKVVSNNNVVFDTTTSKFRDLFNTFGYTYKYTFTTPGLYKYKATLTVTNNITGKIISKDSGESVIDVVK